jgi:hypothetical protein
MSLCTLSVGDIVSVQQTQFGSRLVTEQLATAYIFQASFAAGGDGVCSTLLCNQF